VGLNTQVQTQNFIEVYFYKRRKLVNSVFSYANLSFFLLKKTREKFTLLFNRLVEVITQKGKNRNHKK